MSLPFWSHLVFQRLMKLFRYLHYANQTRAEQDIEDAHDTKKIGILGILWPDKKLHNNKPNAITPDPASSSEDEKHTSSAATNMASNMNNVSDEEWINAQRAIRQASGAACFYLITTDILGPFGMAYSFATIGWA